MDLATSRSESIFELSIPSASLVPFRHNRADINGRISVTPPVELVDDPDEGDEVVDPEAGSAGSEHEEGVRALDVGPARRQRAHPHVARLAEEDPVLPPGMGISDEVELASEQRVERVGHTESLRNRPTGCS